MYIWIGAVFPKEYENKIRNICRQVNRKYNVSELSFTLPQHISLKISFQSKEYKKIIEYLEEYLQDYKCFYVKIKNIEKIDNSLIWLNVEKNKRLMNLHNNLNKELQNKFNIGLNKYDGNNFKFHSTLFQDNESNNNNKLYKELFEYDFENIIKINEIDIGISEEGKVGTYDVIKKIELRR